MDYQIVKASGVAKRAMRKANRQNSMSPAKMKQKKYAMRQYKKQKYAKAEKKEVRLDQDYGKYIEWAILSTVLLGVLSVNYPQLGILAVILSILVIAAIIDSKFKKGEANPQQEDLQEKLQRLVRIVENEKRSEAIELARVRPQIVPSLAQNGTLTEFPYRR